MGAPPDSCFDTHVYRDVYRHVHGHVYAASEASVAPMRCAHTRTHARVRCLRACVTARRVTRPCGYLKRRWPAGHQAMWLFKASMACGSRGYGCTRWATLPPPRTARPDDGRSSWRTRAHTHRIHVGGLYFGRLYFGRLYFGRLCFGRRTHARTHACTAPMPAVSTSAITI